MKCFWGLPKHQTKSTRCGRCPEILRYFRARCAIFYPKKILGAQLPYSAVWVSSSVSLPEILAMSTHSLLNGFPHCNKHSENNRGIVWEIIVVIVFVQNVQDYYCIRHLDLKSHVVSTRDCLQCLFNRFQTPAGCFYRLSVDE